MSFDRQSFLTQIRESFGSVLGVATSDISEDTSMANCKKWDSMNHLGLIIDLEKKFSTKFKPSEMAGLNSVKKILDTLETRHKAKNAS